MSLTRQFIREFNPAIRVRGESYFKRGRVSIERDANSPEQVTARVRGSDLYRVTLVHDIEHSTLKVACTCPYYDTDLCKHIWAAMIAADSRKLLPQAGIHPPEHLVEFDPESGDTLIGDEDDVDEDYEVAEPSQGELLQRTESPFGTPTPWRQRLAQLKSTTERAAAGSAQPPLDWPEQRELLYVVDLELARASGRLVIELMSRDRRRDGNWARFKPLRPRRALLQEAPDANDRHILTLLTGAAATSAYPAYGVHSYQSPQFSGQGDALLAHSHHLTGPLLFMLLPQICATGRCLQRAAQRESQDHWRALSWDPGDAWRFVPEVRRDEPSQQYHLNGELARGDERMALLEPDLVLAEGLLLAHGRAARFDPGRAFDLLRFLRTTGPVSVPAAQGAEFAAELLKQPGLPAIEWPEELRYESRRCQPKLRLAITPHRNAWQRETLQATLSFDYEGTIVESSRPSRRLVNTERRFIIERDGATELAAQTRLQQLGAVTPSHYQAGSAAGTPPPLEFPARRLGEIATALMSEGWHVEAQGKRFHAASRFSMNLKSGIDWFELHATADFDGQPVPLPRLLEALRRGEQMVRLGDGGLGLLPEQWLRQVGLFASLGRADGDQLRFAPSQAGLLDALLATQPEADCDAVFARIRRELAEFSGVTAGIEPPASFKGELRPYQKNGLAWFEFLRRFGFGGCLADDMGLGKTVQVLALLESRRLEHRQRGGTGRGTAGHRPSLAVVPKSLVFNWMQEAARFTPKLRILDHTGTLRTRDLTRFDDYDLVLTTYGTLRVEAARLRELQFDYLILDEAQTIKNSASASAKAARLLQASHRLALSGTPVENHLGELWSLFEFLNPGMLGAATVFKSSGRIREPDAATRTLLSHALRPFLLRRTKEQVAPELPPKVEQTLYCELESRQRKLYDELRDSYRATLLERVTRTGMARAKIQILEALLRLRQAAIHPGLIDRKRIDEPSAKLELLRERLAEVLDEGHKALVFSQFTGMLAILRQRLDADGIAYEYLDGQTRDRQAAVERFQNDPSRRLFLISLKAGGVGLNLTAAQYVFLLDPWWNPAVEAQAIDRTHRIGQSAQVFAYRLIARDTVEEKVLALQDTKRELADAILEADAGVLKKLSREDLELLLS